MDRLPTLAAVHRHRLREIWRSAGWPWQDMAEVELLAAGLVARAVPVDNQVDDVQGQLGDARAQKSDATDPA